MSAAAKIAGFAVVLAAVFAAAALAGAEVDPDVESASHVESASQSESATDEHGTASHEASSAEGHGAHEAAAAGTLPGLAVAQDGYRLIPERTQLPSGPEASFSFRIVDAGGQSVEEFDTEHARRMHLIVVRRDFANFQHLHPVQRADGSWMADVDLGAGGVYRAFADFTTAGQPLTLAVDLFAAGPFRPEPLPAVRDTADAGDGYEVSIESTGGEAGASTATEFVIRRDGEEVDSIEPYLGADGHLVALRQHDLAFLHTHPEGEPGGPGPVSFEVEYPTEGRYRLFLQFKHRGQVRTAAFTQAVGDHGEQGAGSADFEEPSADQSGEAGHGH